MRAASQLLFAAALLLAGPDADVAEAAGLAPADSPLDIVTEYDVSIAGIEIGDAALRLKAVSGGYEAALTGGFRFLFWSGAAEARSLGAHEPTGLAPDAYRSRFESPRRVFTTAIDFEGRQTKGRWEAVPPLGEDFDERVPLTEASLAGAKDPLSAFIINASSGADACARSVKVFSGVVRFDVDLSLDNPAAATTGEPTTVLCTGRYRPVAGHRVTSNEVSRLSRDGLSLTMFEIAPGLWAPGRLGFPTRFGTVALERRARP